LCGQGDACCPVQPKQNARKTILSLKFESQNELQDTERIQRIWYNTAATITPSQSPSLTKLERVDHRLKNLQPRFGQRLKFGCRHYQRVGGTPTKAVVQVDKSSLHPPSCLMKDDWNLDKIQLMEQRECVCQLTVWGPISAAISATIQPVHDR